MPQLECILPDLSRPPSDVIGIESGLAQTAKHEAEHNVDVRGMFGRAAFLPGH